MSVGWVQGGPLVIGSQGFEGIVMPQTLVMRELCLKPEVANLGSRVGSFSSIVVPRVSPSGGHYFCVLGLLRLVKLGRYGLFAR